MQDSFNLRDMITEGEEGNGPYNTELRMALDLRSSVQVRRPGRPRSRFRRRAPLLLFLLSVNVVLLPFHLFEIEL